MSNPINFLSTAVTMLWRNSSDDTADNSSSSPATQPTGDAVERVLSDEFLFEPDVTAVLTAACAVVMVPAVLANLLLLAAIASHPPLRSQHTNIYVANLAVCDLMVVAAECPFVLVQFLVRGRAASAFLTDAVCGLAFFVSGFFGTCSILTMLAIGVERYCAVMHPLQTLGENSSFRAKGVIFFFWSFSVLTHLGQLVIFGEVKTLYFVNSAGESFDVTMCMSSRPEKDPLFSHVYSSTVFVLVYGSTFSTTLALYIRILTHLSKRESLGPDQTGGSPPSGADGRPADGPTRRPGRGPAPAASSRTCTAAVRNTSRMLGCSVLSYVICYSLYFYLNMYYIYYGLAHWNGMTLLVLANWFGALNSLLNPVVSAVFVDRIRLALVAVLTGRRCRRSRGAGRSAGKAGSRGAHRGPVTRGGGQGRRVRWGPAPLATVAGRSSLVPNPR